jgi:ribonucleotide reductase alpha subunit
MTVLHPDYSILGGRIAVSMLHKQTKKRFSSVVTDLYRQINSRTLEPSPLISDETYSFIVKWAERLDAAIVYERDFDYQYFGFKTLERSYLLKIGNNIVERPQHMLMRIAIGIHG